MANLQIKDLPEPLHEELRRRARREGVTVRSYVQRLIEADQALPARSDWLERIRRRRPVDVGRPLAELVDDDRSERDGSAPAPGPDAPPR